jgi:hypothetical protein
MIHVEFIKTEKWTKIKMSNKLSAELSQYKIFPNYRNLVWSLVIKRVDARARSSYMHSLQLQTCDKSSYMAIG